MLREYSAAEPIRPRRGLSRLVLLVLRLHERPARPLASAPLLEVLERFAGLDENRGLPAGGLIAANDHVDIERIELRCDRCSLLR